MLSKMLLDDLLRFKAKTTEDDNILRDIKRDFEKTVHYYLSMFLSFEYLNKLF